MADARDILREYLAYLGLESEEAWVLEQITNDRTPEAIKLDLIQRPSFQARFPAYKTLLDAGRAMSVDEMLAYERTATQMMRAAGLPSGFYDSPEDFGRFMANEVSVAELQQRVQQAEVLAVNVAADVREQFADLYGIGSGDLTAYFLDPDVAEPMLKQRYAAAQTSATAARTGYGALSVTEAEQIGGRVQSEQEARQGFTQLAAQRELFTPIDAGEQAIDRATQLGATFEGDAAAQAEIEKRRARRKATFDQGGSYAGTNAGLAVGSTTR